MTDLFITNTKDRPCISPPPVYKPIKNRLRKNISPGLIVGGLRYFSFKDVERENTSLKEEVNIMVYFLKL